jgi:hypothetical protein
VLLDGNAKLHDIGGIAESIRRYGFKEAVRWEPTLNGGAGGIVAGNGRIMALQMMQQQGDPLPRGLRQDGDEWLVPVLFGVDAETEAQAQAFSIDSNALVVTGGDTDLWDLMALYDQQQLAQIAAALEGPLVTLDGDVLDMLVDHSGEVEKPPQDDLQRWSFVVEYEGDEKLLSELEDLMGTYFMPRSKRKLMPEFFTEMVRSYCANRPVVVTGA